MQLTLEHITKSYTKGKKRKNALEDFTLTLTEGVYGLLGPNGAGKSTLINIITGIIGKDSGSIAFSDGGDNSFLSHLGFMPQGMDFYRNFTAKDYIKYIMALKKYSPDNADEYALSVLDRVNLRSDADKIVILATHIVTDIAYVAKTVVLMNGGKIIKTGTQEELCSDISGKVWEITAESDKVMEYMSRMRVSNAVSDGSKYTLRIVSDNLPEQGAKTVQPTLEDVCIYYFGDM